MPDKPQGGHHYRGHPRPRRSVEVRYRLLPPLVTPSRAAPPRTARTGNLSVGGAYVITADPPAVGSQLELELDLADGRSLKVVGEVRWCSEAGLGEPGMGIKFDRLATDDRLNLEAFLASLVDTGDFDDPV